MNSGALSHIRVLDLTRVLAGPWAGQIFADLGAEVIKIERPKGGDDTRHWGPPWLKDENGQDTSEAAYYLSANRGKKSLTVDITSPQGQEIVRKLACKSDILLENYKVDGLKKYGLDYESLKAQHPGLIYCSITGFGQTGPYKDLPGYDFMIQGMGGLMSVTGERDDLPGGGPQKAGVAMSDLLSGLYSTIGVLAALANREKTGEGQHLDVALLDVMVSCMANQGMNYLTTDKAPGRMGNAHMNIVPYQTFATKDGHMILAVGNDAQFTRFCAVCGNPELAANERYASNRKRLEHREELVPILEDMVKKRTTADWMQQLAEANVPCGPINNLDEVFADPQVQHRNMRIDLPHSTAGTVPLVGSPLKMSATPVTYKTAPPTLGQHNEEVLSDVLGLSPKEINQLAESGAI